MVKHYYGLSDPRLHCHCFCGREAYATFHKDNDVDLVPLCFEHYLMRYNNDPWLDLIELVMETDAA